MALDSQRSGAGVRDAGSSRRSGWIDDLRVAVIVGVIGAHVALIYALDVGWYYEERTASTFAEAMLAALFAPGLLFGMGLMFFVAGMFTPGALGAKGPRRFIADRLRRLGVPLVVYLFAINPAMDLAGDVASEPDLGVVDRLRSGYRDDIGLGVAWFIAALLLFSVGLALWRSATARSRPLPSALVGRELMRAIAAIAIGSFVVRLAFPFLSTGELLGLNLWEYPQMLVLFVLGVHATERGWLVDGLAPSLRRACSRIAGVSVVAIVVLAVVITLTDDPDPFLGGLRVEAMLIPLVEGAIAVSVALWATDWFRRRPTTARHVSRHVGQGSFVAYLVHAPLTVALAIVLRDVDVPAELKLLVVYAATVGAAFWIGARVANARATSRIL